MKAISRKRSTGGGCFLFLFSLIFFCAGSAVFVFLSGVPLLNWFKAQNWEAVPCVITSSSVENHHSSDGTTYSINIQYDYAWNGASYHGDLYNFFSGSSSGQAGKEAVVAQYPPGSERTCFVNPENPAEAVLDRSFSLTYLIGSFGLIFVAVSLSIPIFALRRRANQSLSSAGHFQSSQLPAKMPTSDTLTLKGGNNSVIGCGFVFVFGAIWNGVIGTMLWGMFRDGEFSSGNIAPLLFMTPFVLVGLGCIALLVYFFLALFNPRPDMTLTPGYVPLAGTSVLGWTFRGSTARIHHLTITLEGEEKATYRRGTSSVTDTSVFEKIVLLDTETPGDMPTGEIQFTVPEFTAPSFDAPNNKIVWSIKVHGEIRRWPDVKLDFAFQVSPLHREESGTREPADFNEG